MNLTLIIDADDTLWENNVYFEDAIDRFLSAAVVHGFSTLRIVHGKGTGALRRKTHELLKDLPIVKSFRLGGYGEGDTGVTILELR